MKKRLLFLIFFLAASVQLAYPQNYDYSAFPQMDFVIEHLTGEIEIDEQFQIRGDLEYQIRFQSEQADSIVLEAVRMQVDDVLMEERTMDFEIHNDTLVVYLDDTYTRNQVASLRVVYHTQPVFGVHRTYRGTLFSSQLPRTTRHWLPVADHPAIRFTYDLTARHPASKSFVMSGRQVGNEVISVDREETRYESDTAVPVTTLFFALGDFESESRTVGEYQIHLHKEQPNREEISADDLIELAGETIRRMEELTGRSYPFHNLHIVALHDRVWETRTFGAGAVFLDAEKSQNRQLIYGVAGQWGGVMLREMEWSDPAPLRLLHGYIASQVNLEGGVSDTLQPDSSLYMALSAEHINRYRSYIENTPETERALSSAKEALFDLDSYPLSWQDFATEIYRQTGRYPDVKPVFEEPEPEESESYVYSATIELDEAEEEATVFFNTEGEPVEELVTISAEQISLNETRSREITFSGESGEVLMNVPSGIENIELSVAGRDDIELTVQKPFMFWIYQLQNSRSDLKRAEAAAGLRAYTDNPDLQLALLDLIRNEEEGAVKAEILQTLSMVTDGASGTADLFLERVGDDQPEAVRIQAIQALRSYEGNDRVINGLQSILVSEDPAALKVPAIESLAQITTADQFAGIVESVVTRERVLNQVPQLLEALAETGEAVKAVELSETFLSAEFPYHVRAGVLQLILSQDESQQGWGNRIEDLISDRDPRIRFMAVQGLQYVDDELRENLIQTRRIEEFDERVARALDKL